MENKLNISVFLCIQFYLCHEPTLFHGKCKCHNTRDRLLASSNRLHRRGSPRYWFRRYSIHSGCGKMCHKRSRLRLFHCLKSKRKYHTHRLLFPAGNSRLHRNCILAYWRSLRKHRRPHSNRRACSHNMCHNSHSHRSCTRGCLRRRHKAHCQHIHARILVPVDSQLFSRFDKDKSRKRWLRCLKPHVCFLTAFAGPVVWTMLALAFCTIFQVAFRVTTVSSIVQALCDV